MVEAMGLLKVDYAVPGNHEFDFGLENALKQFQLSPFLWLNTNLQYKSLMIKDVTSRNFVHKHNGLKIGFIGLVTPELSILSKTDTKIMVTNVTESARQAVKELKQQQVDIIVALTHMTLAEDQHLAHEVADIDLILGGHDHYPVSVLINNTLILKSGMNGEYLGVIRLVVDKDSKIKNPTFSWQIISTLSGLEDENESIKTKGYKINLNSYINKYKAQLKQKTHKPLIRTQVLLDARKEIVRSQESSFADIVVDALKQRYQTDTAMINGGAIRSDRVYEKGTVLSEIDILSALPFGNRAVVIQLNGQQLLDSLEHGVAAVAHYSGRFPQVSGLEFEFYPKGKPGQRINKVKINGQLIEPQKLYTMTTSDFLLQGGDGYKAFSHTNKLIDSEQGDLISNIVSSYLQTFEQVKNIKMNRIRVLEQKQGDF